MCRAGGTAPGAPVVDAMKPFLAESTLRVPTRKEGGLGPEFSDSGPYLRSMCLLTGRQHEKPGNVMLQNKPSRHRL